MIVLGGIGFTAPWLLAALLALPILWLILRAVPPAPIRRRFPGVALLLGLKGPVLNPDRDRAEGSGPLLVVLDGSWAGATRWPQQAEAIDAQLSRAARAGRTVGFLTLTQPEPPTFQSADVWQSRLAGFTPSPWQPSQQNIADAAQILAALDPFDTLWFSDGLMYEGRDVLLDALQARGAVEVYQTAANVMAIQPARYEDNLVKLDIARTAPGDTREVILQAEGRDPAGNARILATR